MGDELVLQEVVERRILFIRGQKVMLDRDLAKLYGVKTKRLNEQVHRNIGRFPEDCVPRTYVEVRKEA
ncbi:MAG: ORF6N domain-containing protein [Candidatus Omnitrophota bacterium]|nr:ORF6N domain-containing protein [Candidatus Omnitrophota bacterium]